MNDPEGPCIGMLAALQPAQYATGDQLPLLLAVSLPLMVAVLSAP